MPKLLYSPASPYSAKVRMAAAYAGVAIEAVIVDTNAQPAELMDANPLGKIPVLITDAGVAMYDSRVITQYLNRVSGSRLFPRNVDKRLEAETLEALADGICDCLLAHVYERRFRPEEKIHQPWLDRQWSKVERALDQLNAARVIDDLRAPPANRLEALRGDRRGQHSIRINDQYRICFVWSAAGPGNVEIVDYH